MDVWTNEGPWREGDLCDTAVCEQACVRGKCLRPGYCTCEEGWKGRDCGTPECAMECVHGGVIQPKETSRVHMVHRSIHRTVHMVHRYESHVYRRG